MKNVSGTRAIWNEEGSIYIVTQVGSKVLRKSYVTAIDHQWCKDWVIEWPAGLPFSFSRASFSVLKNIDQEKSVEEAKRDGFFQSTCIQFIYLKVW